ncbi:MAG: glycoside hydrolase, family 38 [Thermoleophilia bacterium]|nr:glycoside hydrolase, family 38 [Thermoleophilia bacterium]
MTTPPASPSSDLQPIELPVPAAPGSVGWKVHVYAHTHWDREWYRTFERFRMQLVGAVDRILDVLDADPSFSTYVLDGQTIVLEDYLELRPEEEARIRRLVGSGRLEVGPWHVLPDEFLVSGESLVRNLLEGRRVASRFGTPLAVGYLPDPFGHVAQLPAILRGFGIDNAIFSRGNGDEFTRTGTEFRWEALDGTDVLAIVQAAPEVMGYWSFEHGGRGNAVDSPVPYEAARALVAHLAPHARTDLMLFAAGADHDTMHAGLPGIVSRLQELMGDAAEVRITGLDAAVGRVRDAERRVVDAGGALERHRGELRGSLLAPILASIFSARIELKQQNDAIQSLLERHVEPLMARAVAAGVRPARDVQPFLRHAWRLVLENHPHDSIGGCSVDLVHEEMPARTLRATEVALGLVEDLRTALGLDMVEVVHDAEGLGGIVERPDGSVVALAPTAPGLLVALSPRQARPEDGIHVDESTAQSADARVGVVEWETESGPVDHVIEVTTGAGPPVRVDFIDEADGGDEYDFSDRTGSAPVVARLDRWATRVVGDGAVAELEAVHVFELPVALTEDRLARAADTVRHEVVSRLRVSPASDLVTITTEFTNAALDHRLRIRLTPVPGVDAAAPADHVEALGHFAIVQRPLRPAEPATTWRQQPPGLDHALGAVRMVDAAGSALVTLAGRGLHEYEARDLGDAAPAPGMGLEMTLVRSVGFLSRDDIAGRPHHAGPALATPGAQCQGRRRVELAVGSGPRASFAAARAFLTPPLVLDAFTDERVTESGAQARRHDVALATPPDASDRLAALGLEVGGSGAVPSACKLADDGSGDLIIRWWAPAHETGARATLRVVARVESVQRARLDESTVGPVAGADGIVAFDMEPGEIATVRVRLAG